MPLKIPVKAYLNCFCCKVIIWTNQASFFYFLCFINDFTIMKKFDSFSPVYTHRIYIDPDYVEFTQDKIYSDCCRLQYNNLHPLSTASKLKFI